MALPRVTEWQPPEAYPAQMTRQEDGRWSLYFPNFQATVTVDSLDDVMPMASAAVRGWLRRRRSIGHLLPFASNPAVLGNRVMMISTKGWDQIEGEDNPDD